MSDLVWYQLWRELPDGIQYATILGLYWGAMIVLDSALTAFASKWRRLNGWAMLAENAICVLCFKLARNLGHADEQNLLSTFASLFAIKFIISLAADALQNRRAGWPFGNVALATAIACLRGFGACVALALLAEHYAYALRFLGTPFLVWTFVDLTLWLILRRYLPMAPFVVPIENAVFVLAFIPAPEGLLPFQPPFHPGIGLILIKCTGSLLAISVAWLRQRPTPALGMRQLLQNVIWIAARMLPLPLLMLSALL